jgi:hypothetical protein
VDECKPLPAKAHFARHFFMKTRNLIMVYMDGSVNGGAAGISSMTVPPTDRVLCVGGFEHLLQWGNNGAYGARTCAFIIALVPVVAQL